MGSEWVLEQLIAKVNALLDDNHGDNWLTQQGWDGIANYSQEEVYELMDAIAQRDFNAIEDELADVLFHLLLYARMGEQERQFNFDSIARRALNKLNARYQKKESNAASHAHWQQQKLTQKWQTKGSVVRDVPVNLPALVQAKKLAALAASLGVSVIPDRVAVVESAPLSRAHTSPPSTLSTEELQREWGALLFTVMDQAQQQGVHAEQALRQFNQRVKQRFLSYEHQLKALQLDPFTIDPLQRASLWRESTSEAMVDGEGSKRVSVDSLD